MEQNETNRLYAVSGQFTTLDGKSYIGPYSITKQGLPMSGTPQSQPLLPVTTTELRTSPTSSVPALNTGLNENQTVYDLIPTIINQIPIVTQTIIEGSIPPIKQSSTADATGDYMYQFPDGTVRVYKNTTITLRVQAQQPDALNVENGKLVIKPVDAELTYAWTYNGEVVGGQSQPALGFTMTVSKNELTLANIDPIAAGVYSCTVSNDIGTTDAGLITLEVYNTFFDSYFFQNLIENGDASDETTGWNTVNGGLVAKEFSTPNPTQKSIETEPLEVTDFTWTAEMLVPDPVSLAYGDLKMPLAAKNTGLANQLYLPNFFTRDPYKYLVKGGLPIIKAYQDIDLTGEIQSYINGSIYGVEGVRGVFCCYLGNAISQYEVNREVILAEDRKNPIAYYLGAPRLSVENFSKAGPGFIQEKVYVTLEEFQNNQSLQSRILTRYGGTETITKGIPTITDPWTVELKKQTGKVYYQGGKGYAHPDLPSLGDKRDAHLFAADALTPDYRERYTYGQYGEFTKLLIERLDPRTNKIRITINIEAYDLGIMLRERGSEKEPLSDEGLWELLPWMGTWPSRSFASRNDDGLPSPNSAWSLINGQSGTPEQKIPRIGLKPRSLITGLTFAIVPIYKYDRSLTDSHVNSMFSQASFFVSSVDSPINMELPPYNAATDLGVLGARSVIEELEVSIRTLENEIVAYNATIKLTELAISESEDEYDKKTSHLRALEIIESYSTISGTYFYQEEEKKELLISLAALEIKIINANSDIITIKELIANGEVSQKKYEKQLIEFKLLYSSID